MRRRLCALAVLATLLVGGCGIPDRSDVTVVGDGASNGVPVDVGGVPPMQNTRESATDTESLADYYLQAAAGDPDAALTKVKAFLAPDKASRFPAKSDITVIREIKKPLYSPGKPEITFIVQVVGVLKSNGVLQPADPAPATTGSCTSDRSSCTKYTLRVGPVEGRSGLFVLDAPPTMLLTDQALQAFYQRRTIYWWNNENTGLVPDLRYMPLEVPSVQQPTTILGWLTGGPAPWLSDAVQSLPQGTQPTDNVPAISNDTLEIRLNDKAIPAGADPGALDRLRRQLQWSMRPLVPRTIAIGIGRDEPVRTNDGDYRESNPADRLADDPERFAVLGGVIRRFKGAPQANDPVPVLKEAANKNVAAAAISATPTRAYVAVVTGSAAGRRLRVAEAPLGQQADLKEVGDLTGSLGTPVWAQLPVGDEPTRAIGLITMNNRLYSFGAAGTRARPVEWQGDPGPISAVSVAPDGRRVAALSGGKLYLSVLNVAGDDITLSEPEQVLPPTLKSVSAVAWSSETYLVVAGAGGDDRYAVLDVTIDGAVSTTRLADIGAERVTYLTAYPSNPVTGSERSDSEAYVAGNEAYDVLSTAWPINAGHLAIPAGSPQNNANPTAPFFLG